MKKYCISGFTMIELIVAMVVISIVSVALFGIFNSSAMRSADPIFNVQALAIAQGYMEEALLKDFQDPDQAETGSCEAAEARATYDDVQDYNCVNDTAGALDQFGNALAGLGLYNVQVTVAATTLGPGGQQAAAQQVTVAVTHDNQPININLIGFRTNY